MSLTSPRRRPAALVAVVTALLLVVAGCSSSESSSSTTTAAGPVVRIGVIAPLEAGLTDFGTGILDSVQLAVDQANAAKAIPGWTIEVVAVDDSSDPAIGAANIPTLIDDPSVIAVVGPYNSGVAAQILPLMAPASLALVSPSNTLASLTLGPDPAAPVRPYANYFRMVASDAQQGPFLAGQALGPLATPRVAVISETKAVSKDLADGFAAALTAGGGQMTSRTVVPDDATDFSAAITAALSTTPDLVFFGGEYDSAAALRVQATAAGYTGPIMGGDGIKDPVYITEGGPSTSGDWASSVGVPLDQLSGPGAAAYLASFSAMFPGVNATNYGPYAFDATNLVIGTAKGLLAGQTSVPGTARAAVVSGLQATSSTGITGPLGFDAFGDTLNRVFTLYQVGPDASGSLVWVPVRTATVN